MFFLFFLLCLCAEQYDIIQSKNDEGKSEKKKRQQAKLDDIKKIERRASYRDRKTGIMFLYDTQLNEILMEH